MRELAGKTAFVTGGAAGIGLALGRAFAQSGMKVMLADIEADALQAAVKSLQEISPDISGTICDVAEAASVERAAQAAFDAFGNVHVVCNNAGVAAGGGIDHISLDNWRWVIDVNLMGVLHGIRSFLPHIRAHGEGGHIVNTASMAGHESDLGFQPLRGEQICRCAVFRRGLACVPSRTGVGVSGPLSKLCPHPHRRERAAQPARSATASRTRSILPPRREPWWQAGIDPAAVAARVLTAIRENQLYVFTHPGMRAQVEGRFAAILAAMDRVEAP